ncbi:hypothetical protein [Pseudactinotalea terrae]|uniref:hypothetical protein n=1 Tax=Pseudactinotalea terrae TaxID=1743262 RepID=UPI001F4F1A16|nr:hypothetical protein [Pseudactinotalea terrae]
MPTRLVVREPVRADPIAVEASRDDEVRVDPRYSASRIGVVRADCGPSGPPAPRTADGETPVALVPCPELGAAPPGDSGEPQTLHHPSS